MSDIQLQIANYTLAQLSYYHSTVQRQLDNNQKVVPPFWKPTFPDLLIKFLDKNRYYHSSTRSEDFGCCVDINNRPFNFLLQSDFPQFLIDLERIIIELAKYNNQTTAEIMAAIFVPLTKANEFWQNEWDKDNFNPDEDFMEWQKELHQKWLVVYNNS